MRTEMPKLLRLSAAALLSCALAATLLVPAPAQAYHGRGGYHGGWGWGLGLGLGLGLAADAAFYNSYYPYGYGPYRYGYPGYYQVAQPVTVVESVPSVPVAVAAPPSYYYCPNPKGYYPNVTTCQTPWQAVPLTPPGVK
jgi:hypothetical protein